VPLGWVFKGKNYQATSVYTNTKYFAKIPLKILENRYPGRLILWQKYKSEIGGLPSDSLSPPTCLNLPHFTPIMDTIWTPKSASFSSGYGQSKKGFLSTRRTHMDAKGEG